MVKEMCSLTLRAPVQGGRWAKRYRLVRAMQACKNRMCKRAAWGTVMPVWGGGGVVEDILEAAASEVRPEGCTVTDRVRKEG